MGGEERSEYGLKIIKEISKELTQLYGKGYDRSNLYHCLKFYKTFPKIVDTMCRQSGRLLSWLHYRARVLAYETEHDVVLIHECVVKMAKEITPKNGSKPQYR